MFWNRKSKQGPERCQLLHYIRQDPGSNLFALIRLTWFLEGRAISVTETTISDSNDDLIPEFAEIVGEALRGGADVSIVCDRSAESLGIKET